MEKQYPLNANQQGIVDCERFEPVKTLENACWTVSVVLFVRRDFDMDAMEKAFWCLSDRYDTFRTRIEKRGRKCVQVVAQPGEHTSLPRYTLCGGEEGFAAFLQSYRLPAIPVFSPRLTRGELYDCGNGTGAVMVIQHHIVTDGYSQAEIVKPQMMEAYRAFKEGRQPEEPKKLPSFGELVASKLEKDKKHYWKDYFWWRKQYRQNLSGFCIPYEPPFGAENRPPFFRNAEGADYERIAGFCKERKIPLPTLTLCASALVIEKVTGKQVFPISQHFHGRINMIQKKVPGLFFIAVPVLVNLKKNRDTNIVDWLSATSAFALSGLSRYYFTSLTHRLSLASGQALRLGARASHTWFAVNPSTIDTKNDADDYQEYFPHEHDDFNCPCIEPMETIGESILFRFWCPLSIEEARAQEFFDLFMQAINTIIDHPELTCHEILP